MKLQILAPQDKETEDIIYEGIGELKYMISNANSLLIYNWQRHNNWLISNEGGK